MDQPEEAVAGIAVHPDPRIFAANMIRDLAHDFSEAGTFWEVGNFMAGWDPYFGFRDWLKVFRTVPSLRKYLLPALAWNGALWLGGRKGYEGYSERYDPGRKYNFRYRSFCTDFLVWESVGKALRHFSLDAPGNAAPRLEACLDLAFQNCYLVPFGGVELPLFSYFPRRDHLVPQGNSVYRLFLSKNDNVADIDTSCLILGSMISLLPLFGLDRSAFRHGEAVTEAFIGLMEEHVHGRGRYGRKSLSYDNGILPGDRGVMTWLFDDHNELDPTSNVNILNYLVQLRRVHPAIPLARIAGLTNGIFQFLANHARDGSLLDQRFQSYYPLGPAYLFWRRFSGTFLDLPEGERAVLDADGEWTVIDAYMASRGEDIYRGGKFRTNPFDRIAAAPFLYEHGILREESTAWLDPESGLLKHFQENHYEIFHLRYPSKIFCAPEKIPFACALDLACLVDRIPST